MKKCIANDIVIIASGCSAQAAAKAGLMDKSARELCGAGLKRVCELADIPPVLHMGSCVDISRMMLLAAELAKDSGLQINQLPVVGCAPEWMSEKAVSIGNYVVATGIDTFLGVDPYVSGSSEMCELLTEGTRKWTGAAYTVETAIFILCHPPFITFLRSLPVLSVVLLLWLDVTTRESVLTMHISN